MKCSSCGSEISDYAVACPYCGQTIKQGAPSVDGTQQTGQASFQPYGVRGQPSPPFSPEVPTSTGGWVLTLFIAGIPVVGFIMYFVWAFAGGYDTSRRNWARAVLIWQLITVGIVILLLVLGIGFPLLARLANTIGR